MNTIKASFRKAAIFICLLSIILTSLTSCTPPHYIGEHEWVDKVLCENIYDISGAFRCDSKAIESDDYGRTLYEYTANGLDFRIENNGYVDYTIYMIDQGYIDDVVYYYEDICYIIYPEDVEPSQNDIEELKAKNDWGKEINYDKISSKDISENNYNFSYYFDDEELCELIKTTMALDYKNEVYATILDMDPEGLALCEVTISTKYVEPRETRHYYAIYNCKDREDNYDLFEIQSFDYQEELHEMKLRNGWIFE